MIRTARRATHRAPGRAVVDYRGLAAPVGRTLGGAAALGAVTAGAAVTGVGMENAHAVTPAPGKVQTRATVSIPTVRPAAPTATANVKLRYGARGEAVRTLQSSLNANGASLAVDGSFGPATNAAVRSFQSSNGLAVDAVVGPLTWAALGSPAASAPSAPAAKASSKPKLRQGNSGDAVRDLQNMLRDRGATFSATGYFGTQTDAAVRAFQSSTGISVDGIVGPATWAKLNAGGGNAKASTGSSSSSSSSTPSTSGFDGDSMVSLAKTQLGARYVWGARNPGSSFDCSGLTSYVYKQHGISIPRTARKQVYSGKIISQSEAVPGDLVAFSDGNWGHIGIYAGNGMIVDASSSKGRVVYRSIWNSPHVFVTYR